MKLAEKLRERLKILQCFWLDPLWIKVHDFIPDSSDTIEAFDKVRTIDVEFQLVPRLLVFKQALKLSQSQVGDTLNCPIRVLAVAGSLELFRAEPAMKEPPKEILDLSD